VENTWFEFRKCLPEGYEQWRCWVRADFNQAMGDSYFAVKLVEGDGMEVWDNNDGKNWGVKKPVTPKVGFNPPDMSLPPLGIHSH